MPAAAIWFSGLRAQRVICTKTDWSAVSGRLTKASIPAHWASAWSPGSARLLPVYMPAWREFAMPTLPGPPWWVSMPQPTYRTTNHRARTRRWASGPLLLIPLPWITCFLLQTQTGNSILAMPRSCTGQKARILSTAKFSLACSALHQKATLWVLKRQGLSGCGTLKPKDFWQLLVPKSAVEKRSTRMGWKSSTVIRAFTFLVFPPTQLASRCASFTRIPI